MPESMTLATDALSGIDDTNIDEILPVSSPAVLIRKLPQTAETARLVCESRERVRRILTNGDDRLVVVVGPCSVHDPRAVLEYTGLLAQERARHRSELEVVERTYMEKPRTVSGGDTWQGFLYDPRLDGSYDTEEGLYQARKLLIDVLKLGLPVALEFLDVITPQYFGDCVSYGAIGARTAESHIHRQLASGLSAPTGFKNGTGGGTLLAVQGAQSARRPHQYFFSVTKAGVVCVVSTKGNPGTHVILRGSSRGPNYCAEDVQKVVGQLETVGLEPRVVIDCSHGNSGKDHEKQPVVCADVAAQVAGGSYAIAGVMIESFLEEGRQDPGPAMRYGVSITDACVGWNTTAPMLEELAAAVRRRRSAA